MHYDWAIVESEQRNEKFLMIVQKAATVDITLPGREFLDHPYFPLSEEEFF